MRENTIRFITIKRAQLQRALMCSAYCIFICFSHCNLWSNVTVCRRKACVVPRRIQKHYYSSSLHEKSTANFMETFQLLFMDPCVGQREKWCNSSIIVKQIPLLRHLTHCQTTIQFNKKPIPICLTEVS